MGRAAMSGARARTALMAILAAALGLRLVIFVAAPSMFQFEKTGTIQTSSGQDEYARNLLATGTYGLTAGTADAELPPLYGLLLAAVYRIAGRGGLQVALLNSACDLLAMAAIFGVGRRLFHDARVGLLAAALTGCYPYLVFQTLTVSDTSATTACSFLVLWAVVRARDAVDVPTRLAFGTLAGAGLGAGLLLRPPMLLLGAGAVAWLLAANGWRRFAWTAVTIAVAAVVVLAPWPLRNARVLGAPILFSTNGGSNLWQGNNADTVRYLRAGYDVQWIPAPPEAGEPKFTPEADARFRARALRFLREHPAALPELLWVKLRTLWSIDVAPRRNPSPGQVIGSFAPGTAPGVELYSQPLFDRLGRLVHRWYWGGLLVLGLAGLAGSWSRRRDVALLLVPLAAVTIAYVITHPSTRYRASSDPAVFVFAAAALVGATVRDRPAAGDAPCCWFGTARYDRPLDLSSARKWAALRQLAPPIYVIGFAGTVSERDNPQGDPVPIYRLPVSTSPPLRYLTVLALGGPLLLWLGLTRDLRIVIAQSPYEGAVAAAVKYLLRLCGRRVSLVVESHGDFAEWLFLLRPPPHQSLYRRLMSIAVRFSLASADAGRAVSNATREQMAARAPRLPVHVFPAWIDDQPFVDTPRSRPPSGCHRLLFAGALVSGKGWDVLMRAFAAARPALDGATLVIAGAADAGHDNDAPALRSALGLEHCVTLAGHLPRERLLAEMDRARLVVVPSLSEALSRVALESMLRGTPVVGSRIPGLSEVVQEGKTGWLAEPGSPDALAAVLIAAWNSADLDARGARARTFARTIVSRERYVEEHRRLFERVLG